MLVLRQSTSVDIRMGPFVDAADGVTPETGVTLGAADQAEVLKADGAATVAMSGTFAAVTGADGWYDYTVQTGDVDTVGEVVFVVQDASVCLPVFVRAMVVEEATYDLMYAASATPDASIADAVWDENIEAAHGTDATAGLLLRVLGAAISNRSNNATLDALLGVTDSSGNDVPNQILTGDTLAELSQAAPAATPSLSAAVMLLYMAMRNAETQTSSTYTVSNDAGTVVTKATLSDDGTTTTKAEMVSGP